jgi:hypothetical protein
MTPMKTVFSSVMRLLAGPAFAGGGEIQQSSEEDCKLRKPAGETTHFRLPICKEENTDNPAKVPN